MSQLADDYKFAESVVLDGYSKTLDSSGRSQKWKIEAIKEDRKNGKYDSFIMKEFVKDVEQKMDLMNSMLHSAKEVMKKNGLPVSKSLVDFPQ